MLASPARIVSTATANPHISPAMAPKAFMRFHQIDNTSTGNSVDPESASDHNRSRRGSVGAKSAIVPPMIPTAGDGEAPRAERVPRAAAAPSARR